MRKNQIHQIAQATTQHLKHYYKNTPQITTNTTYSIMQNWPTITEITYYKNNARILLLEYNQNNIYQHQYPHPATLPLDGREFTNRIKTTTIPYANPNYFTELTNYTDQQINQWIQTNPTHPKDPPWYRTKQ